MTFRMLAVLAWAAGFLVAAEVALEWRAHARGFPTILFGERPAFVAHAGTADAARWGPREGFRFRNAVVAEGRRTGVVRVWISSSSYAEATNVRVDETFPNRLPALLAACGREADVLDPMSRGGADIPAVIDELESIAPAWKPDFAVLYQMSNDITGISKGLFGDGVAADPDADPLGRVALPVEDAPNWTVAAVHGTTLYAQSKTQITARLAQARVLEDGLGARGERVFAKRLRAWASACRRLGIAPVLCTFATSHDRRHRAAFPDDVATQLFTFNVFISIDGWLDTIERLNEVVLRVAKEDDMPVVDVRPALMGRPELYSDFFHFTPQGHRIFAEALAKVLCSMPDRPTR